MRRPNRNDGADEGDACVAPTQDRPHPEKPPIPEGWAPRSVSRVLDPHLGQDLAEAGEGVAIARRTGRELRRHDAAGHYDVAGLQLRARLRQVVGEPGQRIEGMAERVAAVAAVELDVVGPDDRLT